MYAVALLYDRIRRNRFVGADFIIIHSSSVISTPAWIINIDESRISQIEAHRQSHPRVPENNLRTARNLSTFVVTKEPIEQTLRFRRTRQWTRKSKIFQPNYISSRNQTVMKSEVRYITPGCTSAGSKNSVNSVQFLSPAAFVNEISTKQEHMFEKRLCVAGAESSSTFYIICFPAWKKIKK